MAPLPSSSRAELLQILAGSAPERTLASPLFFGHGTQ